MAYVDIQNGDDSDGILLKLNKGLALADKSVITVDTVQDLRDLPMIGGSYPKQVNTLGALSAGDGGSGSWRPLPAAAAGTYTDNLGTVAVPTGGDESRAWQRIRENIEEVRVSWFGLGSGDDTSAVIAAKNALFEQSANETSSPTTGGGVLNLSSTEGVIITQPIVFTQDNIIVTGSGVSSKIILQADGSLVFGDQAAGNNVKHCEVRDLYLIADTGHNAGSLIIAAATHHFRTRNIRVSMQSTGDKVNGVDLQVWQYAALENTVILCNGYCLAVNKTNPVPANDSHIFCSNCSFVLSKDITVNENAAVLLNIGSGISPSISDVTFIKCFVSSFASTNNADSIGIKYVNPNSTIGIRFNYYGGMIEQCGTLVDAKTDASASSAAFNFHGTEFFGSQSITNYGFRGQNFKTKSYFTACSFINMGTAIDHGTPIVGPNINQSGITGSFFSAVGSVVALVPQPVSGLNSFWKTGNSSAINGGTITHMLIGKPSNVILQSQNSEYLLSVTARSDTTFTVGVRKWDGTVETTTPINFYWKATI